MLIKRFSRRMKCATILTSFVLSYSLYQLELLKVSPSSQSLQGRDLKTTAHVNDEYNYQTMEAVHRQRYAHLKRSCLQHGPHIRYKFPEYAIRGQMMVHEDKLHPSMYCLIEKTGSTLLLRIFQVLSKLSSEQNPFNIVPGAPMNTLRRLDSITANKIHYFLENATKFLFVRDPFERLFSGYLDKLYSPNIYFWEWYGTYIVNMTRSDAGLVSRKCGHDVSFREFVKYVIFAEQQNIKRNGHFAPMFDHCRPCKFEFNIIGKMETFKKDIFYILNTLGNSDFKENIMKNFDVNAKHDLIRQEVNFLFDTKPLYKGCITFHDAQIRMWNKLKMRGIVKNSSSLLTTEDITRTQFENQVYLNLANKEEAVLQKRGVLLEAYSELDMEDLSKLSTIFSPDCLLFQYDCRPKYIFDVKL